MRAVIALDLDRTLVFSARSAEPLGGADTIWVEDYQDAPLSLMTAAAHRKLAGLSARHHVVPVTTRTPEQFARLRLPGRVSAAICSNGGVLLLDGVRDREWDARVAAQLSQAAPAADVAAQLALVADHDWVRTTRLVEGLFGYLVAHQRDRIPAAWVADLTAWAGPLGWTVSMQGRKVYVVPEQLSKGTAAACVAERLGGPLLAAGDSLLDRSLLEQAVVGCRPAHGELHELDYQRAGLHVTRLSGARATEEILDVLGAYADTLTPEPPQHLPAGVPA